MIHHHHPVGQLQRLLLIVRHEDRGETHGIVQIAQPAAQILADLGVERAERLVQQQDARLHRQRAGQRHALPLPAGELRRIAFAQGPELHQIEQLLHPPRDLRLGRAGAALAHGQPEADIVGHRHVAEQRILLEHEADAAIRDRLVGNIHAVECDRAAVGEFQPGDDPQQGRLSRARRPQQSEEFPRPRLKIDVAERSEAAEAFRDAGYGDAHQCPVPPR